MRVWRICTFFMAGLAVLCLSFGTPLHLRSQCPGGGGGGDGCEDCNGPCQRCDTEIGVCYDDNCSVGCEGGCGDCEVCIGANCEADPDCYGPVLIDVGGDGYEMTSASNGVFFDIKGDGRLIRLSWTAASANDAWLALDLNGNGRIDNGTELFGSFTRLPGGRRPKNGFDALATYNLPQNGGNGDRRIDAKDAVYSKLLLWVDENHNGVSEPEELFTLPQRGVVSIDLHVHRARITDPYGNLFRYRVKVDDSKDAHVAKFAFDVILRPESGGGGLRTLASVARTAPAVGAASVVLCGADPLCLALSPLLAGPTLRGPAPSTVSRSGVR